MDYLNKIKQRLLTVSKESGLFSNMWSVSAIKSLIIS